ncbi:MAG: Ger(x)C family spore germination protein [Bacillota bacterium]|nr:Ger(x)C family spore germination protein [Bacillota bacterium]
MPRAVIILILILITLILGTGCWDVRDMRNRAFVTAIGLDATEGEASPKYKVTFEVIRPAGLGFRTDEPASIIQTIEADSIAQAIEQLQARISRNLDLAHFRLLLVGEEKAREDFVDVVDYFNRHPEMHKRFKLMFVQEGEAQDVLKMEPLLEPYPSAEIVAIAELEPKVSIARYNPFISFILNLRSMEGRGLAARIMVSEEGSMVIRHGAAVFDNWGLVGWLSSDEAKAANWIIGNVKATIDSDLNGNIYTYFVNKKSVKIIPSKNDDQVSLAVNIETDGTILQQQGEQLDLADPKNITKLENLFAQTIKQQAQSAIDKSQQYFEVDYLGFGAVLNKRMPKIYRELNWEKMFPIIPIDVTVQSKITRTGISP